MRRSDAKSKGGRAGCATRCATRREARSFSGQGLLKLGLGMGGEAASGDLRASGRRPTRRPESTVPAEAWPKPCPGPNAHFSSSLLAFVRASRRRHNRKRPAGPGHAVGPKSSASPRSFLSGRGKWEGALKRKLNRDPPATSRAQTRPRRRRRWWRSNPRGARWTAATTTGPRSTAMRPPLPHAPGGGNGRCRTSRRCTCRPPCRRRWAARNGGTRTPRRLRPLSLQCRARPGGKPACGPSAKLRKPHPPTPRERRPPNLFRNTAAASEGHKDARTRHDALTLDTARKAKPGGGAEIKRPTLRPSPRHVFPQGKGAEEKMTERNGRTREQSNGSDGHGLMPISTCTAPRQAKECEEGNRATTGKHRREAGAS